MKYKKILFLVCAMLIMITLTIDSTSQADDLKKTIRNIAVVYDDSGSMYEDKTWSRANYLLQAFVAMLNEDDKLNLTCMSDIEGTSSITNRMDSPRQETIDDLKAWGGYAYSTPFKAVESAYKHLKDTKTSDDSIQEYWLVILTDGQFEDEGNVGEKLNSYIDEMAADNKILKVMYFGLRENIPLPEDNTDKGLMVYYEQISEILPILSATIAGSNLANDDNIIIDGNILTFQADIPMYSLSLYLDKSNNKIVSINNGDVDIGEVYTIDGTEDIIPDGKSKKIKADSSLYGSITKTLADKILDEGTYTIEFEKAINQKEETVSLMYNPAIAVQLRYMNRGAIVENPRDGDKVDIEAILVDVSNGEMFDPNILGVDTECTIQVFLSGELVSIRKSYKLDDVRLKDDETTVVANVVIPGYGSIRTSLVFDEVELPDNTPTTIIDPDEPPWPPIVELVVMNENQTVELAELSDIKPIIIIPIYNSQVIDSIALNAGEINVTSSRAIDFDISIDKVMHGYKVIPKYAESMLTTSTGPILIDVEYISEFGMIYNTVFTIFINDIAWIDRYIGALLFSIVGLIIFIIVCGIIFIKRKLSKKGYIEYRQMTIKDDTDWKYVLSTVIVDFHKPDKKWKMIPFAAERVIFAGIAFIASSNDQNLIIPKKYFKNIVGIKNGHVIQKKEYKKGYYVLRANREIYFQKGKIRHTFKYKAPKHTLLDGTFARKASRKK